MCSFNDVGLIVKTIDNIVKVRREFQTLVEQLDSISEIAKSRPANWLPLDRAFIILEELSAHQYKQQSSN